LALGIEEGIWYGLRWFLLGAKAKYWDKLMSN
jgi:hypothetical protein